MKTYEEMAQSVLMRIEEYEIEKRSKRQKIRKAALVSVPVCVAVVAAVGISQSGVIGTNNKVPVAEPEKSIVSSVSENEIKTISSSNDSREESNTVSSAVNAQSDSSSELTHSENQSSNPKGNTNNKTESTAAVNTSYYENGNENVSVSENDAATSVVDSTPNHESNNNTETENSQTVSAADEEENFDPEPGFEDTADVIGIIYKDSVMYMQFSVYDDGFTLDENIGHACDFEGTYKSVFKDTMAEVYTVKESRDVLIVKLSNGGTVALAKAGQLIVNGTPYCSTMLDTNVYKADSFIGHISDFETVNVPYLHYDIELSPNDEVYTVADKELETLCIKQENGNVVIFVSMW